MKFTEEKLTVAQIVRDGVLMNSREMTRIPAWGNLE